MRIILKHMFSVLAAGAVFWVTGVLLLPVIAKLWPISLSSIHEIVLKPQSFPCILLGFVLALYVFRVLTAAKTTRSAS